MWSANNLKAILNSCLAHLCAMQTIILASHSPRRKQLLEMAEVNFTIIVKNTTEEYPDNLSMEEIPIHIASEKAAAVKCCSEYMQHPQFSNSPIVAADTIVELNGEILSKPFSDAAAIEMLRKLSGKTHRVITGVCIDAGSKQHRFSEATEVTFYDLSDILIRHYVERYQPHDKAGAYGIQEWIGVVGIKAIKGDYYNVMGLPVSRLLRSLEQIEI